MYKDYLGVQHQFNVGIAQRLNDVVKAILIQGLADCFDESNKIDGVFWTRGGFDDFMEYHSYVSKTTINRKLRELECDGILKSYNFNKSKYDKTKWYTIVDEEIMSLYGIKSN